jgi:hypothetical protein
MFIHGNAFPIGELSYSYGLSGIGLPKGSFKLSVDVPMTWLENERFSINTSNERLLNCVVRSYQSTMDGLREIFDIVFIGEGRELL